jgi:excisionase family DNA binding protein
MIELRTPKEAAEKLRCSEKTLRAHVESGALRYVQIGRGTKKVRRMFTDEDIEAFIESQTRRNVPCLSTSTRAHRSTSTTSNGEVVAFTALRNARAAEKPNK